MSVSSRRDRVAGILAAAFLLLVSVSASASRNDFVLHRFRTCPDPSVLPNCSDGILFDNNGKVIDVLEDRDSFRSFATEFGLALSPKFMAPAETLGEAGFEFAIESSFTGINNDADYWKKARSADSDAGPPSVLSTLQLHLRKGLPFSFEVGGSLTHLLESDMFALGGEIKWAFNEGFYYLPDLAVRASVNRLLGNDDLDLLTGGLDVSISKPFGIGGIVSLTPYAGWNMALIYAGSHVLDATQGIDAFPAPNCAPGDSGQWIDTTTGTPSVECSRAQYSQDTQDWEASFVLPQQQIVVHRGFAGVRLNFTILSLGAEAIISSQSQTYSAKLGFDF